MGAKIAMSRDYQAKLNNPYLLPQPLYRMTLAFIRDHSRKVTEYQTICEKSPAPPDGLPKGTETGDPTERAGLRRVELYDSIKAVEQALVLIPTEYRKGVWANIVQYRRYPDDADPRTYRRYKQKFIYHVAKNKYWV